MRSRKILSLAEALTELKDNPHLTDLEIQAYVTQIDIDPNPILNPNNCVLASTDNELKMLAEAIAANTTLIYLKIYSSEENSLRWLEIDGIRQLGESLRNHPKIKVVDFTAQRADARESVILGFLQCLTGSAKIEHLILQIWQDTPSLLNELGALLQVKNSLKKLCIRSLETSHHQDDPSTSLDDFCIGIGKQSKLQYLLLSYIALRDDGLRLLAETMRPITTLVKLKLYCCAIRTEAKQIVAIALNNPTLTILNIGSNYLQNKGINEITNFLHYLKKLTDLNISDTAFDRLGLDFFISSYREKNLNIYRLNITNKDLQFTDPCIDLIIRLIKNNSTLKDLQYRMRPSALIDMFALLKNPEECQLQRIDCTRLTLTPHKKIVSVVINILDHNHHIIDMNLSTYSTEIRAACELNKRRNRFYELSNFLETALHLISSHYSDKPNKFSKLPYSLLTHILSFLCDSLTDKQNHLFLLQQNLENRHQLIKKGDYNPTEELKKNDPTTKHPEDNLNFNRSRIKSKWWSTNIHLKYQSLSSIESKEKTTVTLNRQLFLSQETYQPHLMSLQEIIHTLKPHLFSKQTINASITKENAILIDLSKQSSGEKRFIIDVFMRYININHSELNLKVDDISHAGNLFILGISLQNMQQAMQNLTIAPLSPKTERQCNVM